MESIYSIREIINTEELVDLKSEWLDTLISPQDGMWESFRDQSQHWGIEYSGKTIGYAAVGEGNRLLQFYISPYHFSKGESIFRSFIDKQKIRTGIVGTNNLSYLSIALNFVEKISVNTYLFREIHKVDIEKKTELLKECQKEDLERIVNFCHKSMNAPKEWLKGYLGKLIDKKEIFFLENENEIIGTCEVRRSTTSPEFVDIGMVVSPDYRRKGYGTYLLNKAKIIALEWGKTPICSCEKENIGSLKSIRNCGFVSKHQLLSIVFK